MRRWSAIVALLTLSPAIVMGQAPVWQVDAAASAFAEAWDFNESQEAIAGVMVGAEARVLKALRVRVEGVMLHVNQAGADAWLRGFTIGTRIRWGVSRIKPFIGLAVGVSDATAVVPMRGTMVNVLALVGGGVQVPLGGRMVLDLGGRWLHVSNNGREGRHRNPDIQAVGAVIAIGWVY